MRSGRAYFVRRVIPTTECVGDGHSLVCRGSTEYVVLVIFGKRAICAALTERARTREYGQQDSCMGVLHIPYHQYW